MNVLLSIKPKYVEEIIKGTKRFEFRRNFVSKSNFGKIESIYIYSSSPIKKIVGFFKFKYHIEDNPQHIWKTCYKFSGINKDDFFKYFENKSIGFAIPIKDLKVFKEPIDPNDFIPNFKPPQSFCYINSIQNQKITDYL